MIWSWPLYFGMWLFGIKLTFPLRLYYIYFLFNYRHYVFTVRYSREQQVDIYRLYVLYRLYIASVNNDVRRKKAEEVSFQFQQEKRLSDNFAFCIQEFRKRYGREKTLRNNNRFIRRLLEKQEADSFYISRYLASEYLR